MSNVPLDDNFKEALRQRFDFAAWREKNIADPNLLLIGYRALNVPAPDWVVIREQHLNVPGRAVWSQVVCGRGDEALTVDVYECNSRLEARELALELLGTFSNPELVRDPEPGVGDVLFRTQGATSTLFCRANLVVILSAASPVAPVDTVTQIAQAPGAAAVPVAAAGMAADGARSSTLELARRIDSDLLRKPKLSPSELSAVAAPSAVAGDTNSPPRAIRVWVTGGEVLNSSTGLRLRRTGRKKPQVEIFHEDAYGQLSPASDVLLKEEE